MPCLITTRSAIKKYVEKQHQQQQGKQKQNLNGKISIS